MEKKPERRGLGRGLSALMADINVDVVSERGGNDATTRRPDTMLPVEHLIANPNQPRRDFLLASLEDLAASIRQKGVLQPLIVRPTAVADQFEIVAGERRWRAAQLAQLHHVPVVIRDFDDIEVLEVAIIENIQRSDLNSIEEAMAYRQLMDKFGHTQEKLAEGLSKSRSHIANLLRLLSLPDDVQSMVREGKITAGHARALVTSPNAVALAQQVVEKGLSVRETEQLVKVGDQGEQGPRFKKSRHGAEKDADTPALEGDVSANLGMAVSINHEPGGERGTITVTYNNLDDLDMLCRVLSMASRNAL